MEQNKKIKTAIIVLAVLLGLSLLSLGGVLMHNRLSADSPTTVTVPDNLIAAPREPATEATRNAQSVTSPAAPAASTGTSATEAASASTTAPTASSRPAASTETRKATSISLYARNPEENIAFQAGNLFPGDQESKYFRILVSHHDQVTVHYKAAVRPGYEKLAEVLMVRIELLTTGETLYDGLMGDMPESLTHKLTGSGDDELYCRITAYLDTSVGNEYQGKDLLADFKWWVEETGNLNPTPATGDPLPVRLLTLTTVVSGLLAAGLMVLLARKRKEDGTNG